jgi:hypothetical protein
MHTAEDPSHQCSQGVSVGASSDTLRRDVEPIAVGARHSQHLVIAGREQPNQTGGSWYLSIHIG